MWMGTPTQLCLPGVNPDDAAQDNTDFFHGERMGDLKHTDRCKLGRELGTSAGSEPYIASSRVEETGEKREVSTRD